MAIDKLNIQAKVDNAAKKKMVQSNEIGVNETLLANEVNALVAKTNELVDAYNFGAPITAFNFKENVPTYADLPLVGNEVNDGYGVIADGLVYVWNGTAFPPEGVGQDLGLKPTGKVEDGDLMAVSGSVVFKNTKESIGLISDLGILDKKIASIFPAINDFPNGYISPNNGNLVPSTDGTRKHFKIEIPTDTKEIELNLSNWAGWAIWSENNTPLIFGDVRIQNVINVPDGAKYLLATVKTGSDVANLNIDNVLFDFDLTFKGNLKENSIESVIPILKSDGIIEDKKISSIFPDINDFLDGYISPNNGTIQTEYPNRKHFKIEIPNGTKEIEINLSNWAGWAIWDENNTPLVFGDVRVQNVVSVPNGGKYLLATVKANSDVSNLAIDNILFAYYLKSKKVEIYPYDIWIGDVINTFVGDELRIYRESIFSGYYIEGNYQVYFSGTATKYNSDKGRYCIIDTTEPFTNRVLKITVKDRYNNILKEKNCIVNCVVKPTSMLVPPTSENPFRVLFVGDSLFHANQNEIGKEFLRMINTNQSENIVGNTILKKTLYLSNGHMSLVGNLGGVSNKYEIANKFSVIMTGKVGVGTENNPFYNPSSSQPDEIGSDGFNKRVDFKWYFESICGTGNCPDVIYLACGVNDIVEYGWTENSLLPISDKMIKVVSRMKKACDELKGGVSTTKIIIVNHQFYPINQGRYGNFEPAWQRKLWVLHYENYISKIATSIDEFGTPVNTYCRVLDCSSQFDVENGYTYIPIRKNARTTDQETYIHDTVHIGVIGSYLYADSLVRDFVKKFC